MKQVIPEKPEKDEGKSRTRKAKVKKTIRNIKVHTTTSQRDEAKSISGYLILRAEGA